MDVLKELRWPLVLGLGVLALARPVVNTVFDHIDADRPAGLPVILTSVITVLWIAAVGFSAVTRPVLTLVCTGLAYAVLSTVLSGVLSPLLTGELQGPLAKPFAIVPMLLVNGLWGAAAGSLALLLQRARGVRPPTGTPSA
ncbi:hypothetical protein [Saccharomonospora cyanea]|nr:hypothetical protein [Saccharomonospora cyanea]